MSFSLVFILFLLIMQKCIGADRVICLTFSFSKFFFFNTKVICLTISIQRFGLNLALDHQPNYLNRSRINNYDSKFLISLSKKLKQYYWVGLIFLLFKIFLKNKVNENWVITSCNIFRSGVAISTHDPGCHVRVPVYWAQFCESKVWQLRVEILE